MASIQPWILLSMAGATADRSAIEALLEGRSTQGAAPKQTISTHLSPSFALHPWNRPRMHRFAGHLPQRRCMPLSNLRDSVARFGRPAGTDQRLTVNVLVKLMKSALTANRATEVRPAARASVEIEEVEGM